MRAWLYQHAALGRSADWAARLHCGGNGFDSSAQWAVSVHLRARTRAHAAPSPQSRRPVTGNTAVPMPMLAVQRGAVARAPRRRWPYAGKSVPARCEKVPARCGDRQAGTGTGGHTGTGIQAQAGTQAQAQAHRHTGRHTGTQAGRHTGTQQEGRHTDRQTCRTYSYQTAPISDRETYLRALRVQAFGCALHSWAGPMHVQAATEGWAGRACFAW